MPLLEIRSNPAEASNDEVLLIHADSGEASDTESYVAAEPTCALDLQEPVEGPVDIIGSGTANIVTKPAWVRQTGKTIVPPRSGLLRLQQSGGCSPSGLSNMDDEDEDYFSAEESVGGSGDEGDDEGDDDSNDVGDGDDLDGEDLSELAKSRFIQPSGTKRFL